MEQKVDKMIIFDMDGTLLDSSRSITKSINYVRRKLGLQPFEVNEVVRLINEPDNDLPKLFYEDKRPYNECRAIFEEHYIHNCIVDMELFEGVEDILQSLQDSYKMCVLTNAYGEFARKMLKHLKVDHYFLDIIGSDDISARKPDPKGIHHLLKKYAGNKNSTVFIGDSLKDEECAKNAGIRYIFTDWGFGESREPDFVLTAKNTYDIQNIISTVVS